jgi:2-haloacid dehalogenase
MDDVTAHNDDLAAAAECGLRTAFVPRPSEYGPRQRTDLVPERDYDVVAQNFIDLAAQLGC